MTMRLMVAAGPTYDDAGVIVASLDAARRKRGVGLLIHGSTTVADQIAAEWAIRHDIPHTGLGGFPDYARFEPFERVRAMIRISLPDGIIAFPETPGVDHLNSKSAGIPIQLWEPVRRASRVLEGPRSKPLPVGVSRAILRREWYRGAVYVIGYLNHGDVVRPYKVGRVEPLSVVAQRVRTLQTASPRTLVVAHVVGADISSAAVEQRAHDILADCRMIGEWFDCSLAEAIKAVNQAKREELTPYRRLSSIGCLDATGGVAGK